MTVRVNKSSFNIREKLSELGRKFGLKGSELVAAETVQEARDIVSAGRKNMVINGDMRIDQRYGGSSRDIANGANEYVIDRFMFRDTLSTSFRVQRNTLSASTDPPGFRYAAKMSCLGSDTSISNTEYLRIQQYIETNNLKCDWGIHNTDYLTLSFWVKSSVPGKYYANLEDGDASPLYLKPYYINQADTWQKVELTYPPPPSGNWTTSTDNGIGMRITWSLTIGSNYVSGLNEGWTTSYHMAGPDQVNLAATSGNAFWLTGVQLERGRNATEFEHRSYGEELALCQRYFIRFSGSSGAHGTSAGDGGFATLANWTTSTAYGPIFLGTEMRTPPSLAGFSGVKYFSGGNQTSLSGSNVAITGTMTNRVEFRLTGLSNLLQGGAGWVRLTSTNDYIDFNAEF